ncbi:MAG: hypothetical protein ACFFD2_04370 [Promethearchaeota archaeon]
MIENFFGIIRNNGTTGRTAGSAASKDRVRPSIKSRIKEGGSHLLLGSSNSKR